MAWIHRWPRTPVMELLRLSPLRGGYSFQHRWDERLGLLDTHHTFTLDSRAMFGIMEDESGRNLELWAEDESPDEEGNEGGPGPP